MRITNAAICKAVDNGLIANGVTIDQRRLLDKVVSAALDANGSLRSWRPHAGRKPTHTREFTMSVYQEKLDAICADIESMPGTGGARALRSIITDLNGDGPVGELLHTLDQNRFEQVIDLFLEFRRTGRRESFNAIHSAARARVSGDRDE